MLQKLAFRPPLSVSLGNIFVLPVILWIEGTYSLCHLTFMFLTERRGLWKDSGISNSRAKAWLESLSRFQWLKILLVKICFHYYSYLQGNINRWLFYYMHFYSECKNNDSLRFYWWNVGPYAQNIPFHFASLYLCTYKKIKKQKPTYDRSWLKLLLC